MASDRIKIFVTGGTFDKEYNEITAELYFNRTHLADMLRLGRCHLEVAIETLMMIDSLQMTDAHRQLLLDRCARDPAGRIVITHGTGAMIPYTFGSSDGLFNLGTALAFVQTLEPGVYVAMNGRCFPWHSVRKNRERGIFEEAPRM
jgi:L-asparaginase